MSSNEQNQPTSHETDNNKREDETPSEMPGEDGGINKDDINDEELKEEFLEEEIPIEGEELLQTYYQVKNKDGAVAAVGDHAQVTIYNYIQIMHESRKRLPEDDHSTLREDGAADTYRLIEHALQLERQSGIFFTNPAKSSEGAETPLLTGEDEIAQWYYELDEYEQCYVQAVAILHGASVKEVSGRADNLFMQINAQEKPSTEAIEGMQAQQQKVSAFLMPLHNKSSRKLHMKTYTLTQRIENVERLFWRDIDSHGISTFEFRLLDFLAGEFMNKGLHGQNLLEVVRRWSQESEKEYSWLSARALGIFLWRQDVDGLRRRANEWARNDSVRGWRRTAMLLDSAYEIDSLKYPEKGNNAEVVPALQILRDWVQRGQQTLRPTDIFVKCAAANTYALIGKRTLVVALDGLKELLPLTRSASMPDTNKLFAAVVSAYVSLSWSGHIYGVLQRLAQVAAEAVLQQTRSHRLIERDAYRLQCEEQLEVTLKAFFLIAADSLAIVSITDVAAYKTLLPDIPSLPDPFGRDVVLAGLLQDTKGCREQIITLLSAAIIERNRSNRPVAFDLLKRWAEIVLTAQAQADEDEKRWLLISFTQFMTALGKTIHSWCCDLKKRKKHVPPADMLYKKQLEQWSRGKHPMASFAQDVLYQLNRSSI